MRLFSVKCLMCGLAALTGNAWAQAQWTGYTAQPRPASLQSNHGNSPHAGSIIPASAKKSHVEASPILSDGGGCSTYDAGGYGGCDSGYCDANEGSHGLGHFSRLFGGGSGCGSGWYAGAGSLVFDYDIMFMKYHQSGGVKSTNAGNLVGNADSAEFDFEYSPRVSLGYELCNGLGYRINYWYFDETAPTNNAGFVSIDTFTFDAEIYRRIDLTACTSLELSGGYRYLDFEQRDEGWLGAGLDWGFANWGGTISTELSHQVTCNHRLFVRSRLSIVMGDIGLSNAGGLPDVAGTGLDHETTMIELALGWEGTRCMCNGLTLVYGVSGNWSQWSDAAVATNATNGQGTNGQGTYMADAGFGGFALRLGLEY